MNLVKNVFQYFKPSEDNFVTPINFDEELLTSIVSKFHNTHSSKDFKDFHKDIVSGLLKESAFKSGLDVFYKDLFDVLGFYNHFTGDLTFNNKLFKNRNNLGSLILTTSHEMRHKTQMEKFNKELKHFSKSEYSRFPHCNKYLGAICGIDSAAFYHTSKVETDAELYSSNFTFNFLKQIKEISEGLYGNKYTDFYDKQIKNMELYKNCFALFNKSYSYNFLKNLPLVCINCSNAFNDYYSLTYSLMKGEKLSFFQQISLNELNKARNGDFQIKNHQQMFEVLSDLIAVCPIRANVEKYIHLALQSDSFADNYLALNELLEKAPVLKSDVSRFFISNYFVSNKDVKIPLETLGNIDDSELAKNMLMCYGKDKTLTLLNEYKKATVMHKDDLNFDKLIAIAENFTKNNIIINNKEYSCCCDVLEDAINKIMKDRNFDENARNTLMVEANLNLSNIITHFGLINFNDKEFLQALTTFYQNPIETQFEQEEEIVDTPFVYNEIVAKNMGRFLKAYREQDAGIVRSFTDLEFDFADEDGVSFVDKEKELFVQLEVLNVDYVQSVKDCKTTIKHSFKFENSNSSQDENIEIVCQ